MFAARPDPAVPRPCSMPPGSLIAPCAPAPSRATGTSCTAGRRCRCHTRRPISAASPLLLGIAGRLRLLKERFHRRATRQHRRVGRRLRAAPFRRRNGGARLRSAAGEHLGGGSPAKSSRATRSLAAVGHERRSGSGLQGNARARIEARRRARGTPPGSWTCLAGMAEPLGGLPRGRRRRPHSASPSDQYGSRPVAPKEQAASGPGLGE